MNITFHAYFTQMSIKDTFERKTRRKTEKSYVKIRHT